jgi:hypothetical protein
VSQRCDATTTPGPFILDEKKLRAALHEEERDDSIIAFDPMEISADEIHQVVDDCLSAGIIERPSHHASLAIYPLSMSDPEPILAVDPGFGGPLLLGGSVEFRIGDVADDVDATSTVLANLVDQANRIVAEAAHSYRGLLSSLA